jgi:myosin heavy subunit
MEVFAVPASLGPTSILISPHLFGSYLLEKSRVVHQQDAERNYHFFYQIVAAAADNAELARTLLLSDTDEHYYISQSSINVIEGVSDLEEFNEVQSAMEVPLYLFSTHCHGGSWDEL